MIQLMTVPVNSTKFKETSLNSSERIDLQINCKKPRKNEQEEIVDY